MISVRQLKAARDLLGWSQDKLASKSGAAPAEIETLESVDGDVGERADKIVRALQAAGVEFIPEDGDGVGVRLKKAKPEPIDTADLNASNDE
jgi:transcriptional regulator with XRE-family HTH domain